MSLHSFGSGRNDDQASYAGSTASDRLDELAQHEANLHPVSDETSTRSVNIMLDQTAFVRGIGNIKRWFNEEYVDANLVNDPSTKILLNIYIPSYTLHEFDFVKKGTSMMATNAREAIRFIDNFFEKEEQGGVSKSGQVEHHIYLETPREAGPVWEKCNKYKVHTPKIKEFPNFKTKFDSHLLGQPAGAERSAMEDFDNFADHFGSSFTMKESHRANDIQYENSASYQYALANSDQEAVMPARLRYLIRSCVYKRYIEKSKSKHPSEQWKLVTEDSITKIWARSYGIDCLNVNEAEVLIFQNHDINQFKGFNPHNTLKDEPEHESNILQSTIDTTQYHYQSTDKKAGPKGGRRRRRKNKVEGVVGEGAGVAGDQVKMERFDAINFAPRGTGTLWKP